MEQGGESYCRQGAPLINDSTEQHLSPRGDLNGGRRMNPASSQGPSTQAPGKDSNQEFDKLVHSLRNQVAASLASSIESSATARHR